MSQTLQSMPHHRGQRRRRTQPRREQKGECHLYSVVFIALLAWIILCQFTLDPKAAQAQQPSPTLTEMHVSLWPEYDDPRLLVVYRGRFDDATTFPRTVTLAIPLGAEVNAAAYVGETGELLTAAWRTRQEGEFQIISIDLPAPSFQLEFYHDAIRSANGRQNGALHAIQGATDRNFVFTFQAPYPVQSLRFDVQQPLTASDLQMDPPPTEMGSDAAGFQYAIYDFGAVAQNHTIELHGSYVKESAETSVPPRRPSADVPATTEPSVAVRGSVWRPVLLGAAVVLFGVAVAASVFWLRRKPFPRRQRASPRERGPAPAAFCTQCGNRLSQGDRFCRQCGAPVSAAPVAKRQRRRSRKGREA